MRADALAALCVSGIVFWVSLRLGRQAIDVLLDSGVQETTDAVERAVSALPGVTGVRRVRVHQRPVSFVDMHAWPSCQAWTAAEAHDIALSARAATCGLLPGADDRGGAAPGRERERAHGARARGGGKRELGAHDIQLRQGEDGLLLDLHVEVPGGLSLAQAHERVSHMEADIRRDLAGELEPHAQRDHAH